jgi:hypothetical protein
MKENGMLLYVVFCWEAMGMGNVMVMDDYGAFEE